MKSIVVPTHSLDEYIKCGQKCFLLPVDGFCVSYEKTYTSEEISSIRKKYPDIVLFVVMNKTIFNQDLELLQEVLEELDKMALSGIFFYDLAFLQLKKRGKIKTDLVWNQTHMVTNAKTCNYYLKHGVKYASIASELEKSEIMTITQNTDIQLFYPLLSLPIVAHSRRKLLTNYAKSHHLEKEKYLSIHEKVGNQDYFVTEEKEGSSFFYGKICNHYSLLENLNVEYVILNESYIEHELFIQLLVLTNQYLEQRLSFQSMMECVGKYLTEKSLFLDNKTIYRVKKEGK